MTSRIFLPLIFTVACGSPESSTPTPDRAVPVQVAPVVAASQAGAISVSGVLGAKDEITLSFKIGGIVARVMVDDGATARRGQVLATLDQREIDALLSKATAGAEKARRDAQRVERLYRDSVATIAQLQDAQTARDAAEADLRAARVNKEYATIVAPNDGVVLMRIASAGQMVGAGTPVIQFGSKGRGMVLRAGLPDRDAVRVRVGDAATVTFEALPGKTFNGRVSQVGAAADPRTGLITIEIAMRDVAGLPSGLVGRAAIKTKGTGTGTVGKKGTDTVGCKGVGVIYSVPAEALVEGNGERGTVFTVDSAGTRARRLAVQLVGLDRDRVLVRGLDGVTRVVRSGAAWLSDSARVEIKP